MLNATMQPYLTTTLTKHSVRMELEIYLKEAGGLLQNTKGHHQKKWDHLEISPQNWGRGQGRIPQKYSFNVLEIIINRAFRIEEKAPLLQQGR